ncbi:unnamed protein product [Leptosia nina]|uniref:aralkylamine N-acetyltransferase n=1 Tax=Leptosia nina TaxID=320188 RepID=A0AAV1J2B1_9NEOP
MTDYTVQRVTDADTENVLKFLRRTFFVQEPVYKKVAFTTSENDERPELDIYLRYTLPGISFKAIDSEGNIVGVLISGTQSIRDRLDSLLMKYCTDPNLKMILQMSALMESGAQLRAKYPDEEKIFEITMAATDEKWQNKGIMKTLMQETEKVAKETGLRLMRMDTTSAYSSKAAEKFGFKCIYKRAFTDINIIVPDPPHEFDQVFIKELF